MNERLRQLYDRKQSIWARMQEIDSPTSPARRENRDLTAEELEAWNRADAELADVCNQIEHEERVAAREREMRQVRTDPRVTDPTRTGGGTPEERQAEYARAFDRWLRYGQAELSAEDRTLLRGGWRNFTEDEQRAFTPEEQRAMSVGTGSAGGYAVPEGFGGRIIETLTTSNAVRRAIAICGGQPLTTANGIALPFPTNNDTGNTGELIAENASPTDLDLTLGQKTLNAYIYSSKWVKASLALLEDNGVNLDDYIGRMLGLRIGRIQNTHFTTGDDTGKPNGVVTAASVGKTAAAQAAITFDELIDLQDSVDEAYRMGSCCWMMRQSTLTAVRKLKDSDGQYIWRPGGQSGEPDTLLGFPYVTNPDVAALGASAKTVLFGDFSAYQVRDVRDITLVQARERFIDSLQVGFLAFQRADGDLLDTAAVKVLQMAA